MQRLRARAAPTYDTPFTRETEPWGSRTMLPVQPRHPDIAMAATGSTISQQPSRQGQLPKLSVVSYNVLADSNSFRARNCPPSVINWGRRREVLLKEIFSVRADVLCLQDVDRFDQWWSPQLTSAGYDSLFKQRTDKAAAHREGVVIAWKRDMFDLFRSGDMELNRLGENEEDRSLAGKASKSDNVALLALLQPWQDNKHPSGACVVCTQLHDEQGPSGDAVRFLQACGLTRSIEAFNADFHLPVLLCGTMNCVPSSGAYEILCRGVQALDPVVPGRPGKPLVEPLSTSTAHLRWAPPHDNSETLSPPVDTYKVLWIPGGSRFLPGETVDVRDANCLVYDLIETENGNVRSEQNPLRSFFVTGLSSGVAYEFRVAAINALGQGPWSERSEPVRMHFFIDNPPEDRTLLGAASIKLLRKRELKETRRRAEEKSVDPRAYELRKLVKIDGLLDLETEDLHPFSSASGMTPRYSDAALHPDCANVRSDTGFPSIKPISEGGNSAEASATTGRQRRRRAKGADEKLCGARSTGDGSVCSSAPQSVGSKCGDASFSTLRPGDEAKVGISGGGAAWDEVTNGSAIETGAKSDDAGQDTSIACDESLTARNGQAVASGRDQEVLLRLGALEVSGARSERQQHTLGLRSAYTSHTSGGEPAFTMLSDELSGTVDYIFFSASCLLPSEVLSLPEMGSLAGRDIQQTELAPIPGSRAPKEWQGGHGAAEYVGEWSPYLRENPRRVRHRIPNEVFPSDHLMLVTNLVYFEPRCPSTWR